MKIGVKRIHLVYTELILLGHLFLSNLNIMMNFRVPIKLEKLILSLELLKIY